MNNYIGGIMKILFSFVCIIISLHFAFQLAAQDGNQFKIRKVKKQSIRNVDTTSKTIQIQQLKNEAKVKIREAKERVKAKILEEKAKSKERINLAKEKARLEVQKAKEKANKEVQQVIEKEKKHMEKVKKEANSRSR